MDWIHIRNEYEYGYLLVFLNAYRNNPQAHGSTVVAFHPEVNLLSSLSMDNTRIE
jgi:hypothetical protein